MPPSRLYKYVPIFHQVIWNSVSDPQMGLTYEFGIHIQHRLIPIEAFAKVYKWVHQQKRHMCPITRLQNLQSMCINTLHKTYGVRHASHYRLSPQAHSPFLFFNMYTYHVYYDTSTNYGQSLSLFEIKLLVKYGVDFMAPVVQRCFLSHEPITDPRLLLYSLYHIYMRIYELTSRCSKCEPFGAHDYAVRCLCQTCQILDAMYYFIQKSQRIYQRRLTLQRQQMPRRSRWFIKYLS